VNNKIKVYSNTELNDRKRDLEDIKAAFDKLGLSFFLIDGVLLGAIREQNFIKWDWDVELAVFEEEIMPNINSLLNELFSSGFEIININPFSSFFKINIMKRGTKFSLVGLKKTRNKWRYRALFRYPAKLFDDAQFINFLGTEYLIPYPPEEMLTFIYGQWKTPLRSVKQSEYLNQNVLMPRFLFFLIRIRHFITEYDSYLLRLKMKVVSIFFPDKREYLFSNVMLKKALSEDCIFLEIGSSDGLEMSNAIEFTNGKVEGYLVEPSVENLEKSKQRIQLKNKKYNTNISYINKAVSNSNKGVDYYFSFTNPNLSGITLISKHMEKRRIESITIREFLSKENISLDKHLVIKMDVEGAEIEILKSSIKILSQISRVSILLEVHPHLYKGNEMKEVLDDLFLTGFKTSFIESAGVRHPEMFVKLGLVPIMTYKNRALYSRINNDVTSNLSSRELLNIGTIPPYFTKKIVRSVLIEK
jgi:FkbM family methyltransferase